VPPVDPENPSRDELASAICPVCQSTFVPAANQRYCSKPCRDTAWRRRRRRLTAGLLVPDAGPQTIYACAACGTRTVGQQLCPGCRAPTRRIGLGGHCPHCDGAVAIADLLAEEVVPNVMS
jgi:predicted amidophosphoribosyltransferase